jgi:hypothetical protein
MKKPLRRGFLNTMRVLKRLSLPPDDYSDDVDIYLHILLDTLADGADVHKQRSYKQWTPEKQNKKRRRSYDRLKLILRKLQEKEQKQLKRMSQQFHGISNQWWIQRIISTY